MRNRMAMKKRATTGMKALLRRSLGHISLRHLQTSFANTQMPNSRRSGSVSSSLMSSRWMVRRSVCLVALWGTHGLVEKVKNAKPDLSVLKDYRKREEEFLRRAADLDEITKQRDEKKAEYEGLTDKRLAEFMAGFTAISLKLKEMYQMITLGGNAELELVDSMDPFSEGIIFSVMPPKKSWKNISNLSGGEKVSDTVP